MSIDDEHFEAERKLDLLQRLSDLSGEVETLEDTVTMLQQLLLIEPEDLEARSLLRNIQIDLYESDSSLNRPVQALKAQTLIAQAIATNDYEERLKIAEKALTLNPFHIKANILLANTARELGMMRVAAFGYETLLQKKADDMRLLRPLAKIYESMQDYKSTIEVYEDILEIDPEELDASEGLIEAKKKLSAQQSRKEVPTDATPALAGEEAEKVLAALGEQLADLQKQLTPLMEKIESAGGATKEQKSQLEQITKEMKRLQLAMLKEEARLEPDDMEVQWLLGEKRYESGHFKTAFENFETTSHEEDYRHDAFVRMAHCLVKKAYQETYYSSRG